MSFLKTGASAIGRLLIVASLAITFIAGMAGVFYLSLTGEEIEIPKIVGKNFNTGQEELSVNGLRIKKIATRYSEEKPNTILEQRPRAGTTAKSGLIISVVVSKENPDATEAPASVKDDDDEGDEIEDLPELKTDKPKKKKKKKKKKTVAKTRDVIEDTSKTDGKDLESLGNDSKKEIKKPGSDKNTNGAGAGNKPNTKNTGKPKTTKPKPPKTKKPANNKKKGKAGETRPRKIGKSN